MPHHDRAVGERSADALDDGAGLSPADAVAAAQRPADQRRPREARAADGGDAGVAERRPEEAGPHAGGGFDRVLGVDDLVAHRPRHAEGVQAIVEVAVHAQAVAGGVNLPHDVGMAACLLAQHDECCAVAGWRECFEHAAGRDWVRSIVEGECDARAARRATRHHAPEHLEPREEHAGDGECSPADREGADQGKSRRAAYRGLCRKSAEARGRRNKGQAGRAPHACSRRLAAYA